MADTTIDLLKNSSYVGKMDELIAAVKLGSGATSDVEWDNVKNKPTTIGGYGIIDAKIENGTITLGNQTITPLTSAPVTSVNSKTGAVTLSAADVSAIPSTLTGTAGQVLTKTADGQEWKDVEIPSGGGGNAETWECIADQTLTEDVKKVEYSNLSLKKVMIHIFAVGSDATTSATNGQININEKAMYYSNSIGPVGSGTKRWIQSRAEVANGMLYHLSSVGNNNTFQSNNFSTGWLEEIKKIETISIITPYGTNVIGAGTRIRVLGVANNENV